MSVQIRVVEIAAQIDAAALLARRCFAIARALILACDVAALVLPEIA